MFVRLASRSAQRDQDKPYEIPWQAFAALGAFAFVAEAFIVYSWRDGGEGLAAIEAFLSLCALVGATIAALYAYSQYREWVAEHHRAADIDMWIEIAERSDSPGVRLAKYSDEGDLPAEADFTVRGQAVVRVAVHVRDRFSLRNCTLNIVVPADYDISPMHSGGAHRVSPTVSMNARVNPHEDQYHGVRYTVWTGELSPRQYFTAAASLTVLDPGRAPFRLMAELSCTPATPAERDSMRFALLDAAVG